MNKELFYSELSKDLKKKFGTSVEKALPWQLHESLSATVMELIDSDWENSRKAHLDSRRACYLSMEFLMGRAVYNNLLCLGITDEVDELLKAHGRSLNDLEEIEDAALGNGGLGRLAACFLDSAAAHDLPLDGYGIRYKYGLFKQKIVDGFQKEEADNWTKYGDPWSKRCENDKVVVKYGDQTVYAVPYDMPVIGFGTKNVGTLRLWQAESVEDFDFAQFDCGNYDGAVKAKNDAENISKVLYPNDNCEEGKILRLKQEYFFSSASVTDILKKHLAKFGTLDNLGDFITIQLNDTHPVIAVPELIRQLCAERFQNKTNGITQRRWLALCNPELSALITKLLGNADWVKNLDELKKLEKYADDEAVLNEFMAVKEAQKNRLAAFVKEHDGVDIDPNTIFDIQIKRLHEYKRQFLNALSILYIYYGIKDGSIKDFTPTTFIFGAKSAPGYRRAKAIIKFIGEISKLVNADPDTKDLIKVVFVQNYNVSYAEKLVTAADVSEQISTAGTEASGTGNMKLMLNGAVTLGTYDGANVEIVQEAGEENNYIFGARVEELAEIMPKYDPREILFSNDKIKRVLDKLIDGSLSDGGVPSNEEGSFKELYKALTDGASWHVPDHYYVLGDLESYVQAKLKVNADYKDKLAFAKKCWLNIANAGKFSSDRTIKDYAENIWKIEPVKL